jgi:hypothetical protein
MCITNKYEQHCKKCQPGIHQGQVKCEDNRTKSLFYDPTNNPQRLKDKVKKMQEGLKG